MKYAILAPFLFCLLIGCGGGTNVSGIYKHEDKGETLTGKATLDLRSDGTALSEEEVTSTEWEGKALAKETGKYVFDAGVVTATMNSTNPKTNKTSVIEYKFKLDGKDLLRTTKNGKDIPAEKQWRYIRQ